jgi:MarR family transcriptional repressor of emrRAB
MSESSDRLINLFGALALGVTDRVRWAALGGTDLGGETAAALIVIGHAPGLSIQQLGRVLRLSHPGTVRLLDRLTSAGLAVRSVAPHDRRVAVLKLTKLGHTRRAALLKRRREALEAVLKEVDPQDRPALERLTEAMLRSLPNDATSALTVCRFCNDQLCPDCPMDAFGVIC